MNLVTQAVARAALSPWPTPMVPAAFASAVLARALGELGLTSPLRLTLDARDLRAEGERLKALTAEPGPGYLWLGYWDCGIVLEVSGSTMVTVDSDGRTVTQSRRPVTDAALGFVDPGLLVGH